MKYTDEQIQKDGEEIFGEYSLSECREALPAYLERLEREGKEMDLFIQSLPNWVSEDDYFDLWLMNDKERETWLAKNSPYFQRTTAHAQNAKTVKIGGIIIR